MLAGMQITPPRRRAMATVLAFILAIESVSAVAAAGISTTQHLTSPQAEAPVATSMSPRSAARKAGAIHASATPSITSAATLAPAGRHPLTIAHAHATATSPAHATAPTKHRPKVIKHHHAAGSNRPKAQAAVHTKPAKHAKTVHATSFTGRNHVWIPALGVNRSISSFACSRSREPDNYVYRWGCAGTNNVYLLGHAWGVFKPLHDAYVRGNLKAGMKVWYADGSGRVTAYAVRWWKVVKPTTAASWAWAAQSTPSMTLQTCVGALSQNRLMVRLTKAG
jgi:hypothetical protein